MIEPSGPRPIPASTPSPAAPFSQAETKPLPTPIYPHPATWPSREIRAKLVNSAYREMTENVVDKSKGEQAWVELDQRLDKIWNREEKIANLCAALEQQDWDAPIFDDMKQLPDLALLALREKKLTSTQFATVMSYWAVRKHHPRSDIEAIKIFEVDGSINPQAEKILRQTTAKAGDYQSTSTFEAFMAEVRKLPRSEQVVFVVPDLENKFPHFKDPRLLQIKGKISIGQNLRMAAAFAIFAKYDDDKSKRLITPLGLQQAYINTSTPYPVQLIPTIGLFPGEEMEVHGSNQTRPFAVPFPNSGYPDEVDNFKTPLMYDITWHDLNHAIRASFVPPNHQKGIVALASGVKEITTDDPLLKLLLEKYYDALMDMDFPWYIRDDSKNPFLDAINLNLILAMQTTLLAQLTKEYKESHGITDEELNQRIAQTEREIENVGVAHYKDFLPQLAKHCAQPIQALGIVTVNDITTYHQKEEEGNPQFNELSFSMISYYLKDAMKA